MVYHYLFLDQHLKPTLHALEAWFGVPLDRAEIQRVLSDRDEDQTGEKTYLFYQHAPLFFQGWQLEGLVEAYEPETLLLICRGSARKQQLFTRFFAEHL